MDTQSLLILIGFAVVIGLFWYMRRPDLSAPAAHALVAEGAALVDVRSLSEFGGSHLAGARNIPVGEIAHRSAELGAKDRPIVVYCASGMRSAAAKRMLKSAGFSRVYNLGAMSNW
jgi:rhodanese-related sulfurtransferase